MRKRWISLFALAAATLLSSCEAESGTVLEREPLFTLGIGRLEDQLDLFTAGGILPRDPTHISMRDGLVYVANGAANKLMEFTSFGDLVRLIYNQQQNPTPVTLGPASEDGSVVTRVAVPYPFVNLGLVAVDSQRNLYAEDRLPPERAILDETLGVVLSRIVVRFDDQGLPRDYIGQEGIGGTPFAFIQSLAITDRNELVVTSATGEATFVHIFAPTGELIYTVELRRDRLPLVSRDDTAIPVLSAVAVSPQEYRLYLMVSYYVTAVDAATGRETGIEFDHSRVYWLDLDSGRYEGWFELPRVEPDSEMSGQFELVGVARGEHLFFTSREDATRSRLIIVDDEGRVLRRRSLFMPERELVVRSLSLTSGGVLTALLGYPDRAEVVWWRTDRLLPGVETPGFLRSTQ